MARKGRDLIILDRFCQDNDFTFTPTFSVSKHKGALFHKGDSRVGSNGISGILNGNSFLLFEYSYSTASGKNRSTHSFRVIGLRLAKKFPHIFLDNYQDPSLGKFEFDRSQQLELEGSFNKYFGVYGPKEYEIEVLQILNPKVMQALLGIKEPVDIEIIDDILYIYDKGTGLKKDIVVKLFTAMQTIADSTKNMQRTFKMAKEIGNYKPVIKKSIWPKVTAVIVFTLWLGFMITNLLGALGII